MSELKRKYIEALRAYAGSGFIPGPLEDACQSAEWALHETEGGEAVEQAMAWSAFNEYLDRMAGRSAP